MLLLRTQIRPDGSLEAQQFPGQDRPPYAILSHTWGDSEVLFADLTSPDISTHPSFHKIRLTLEQANRDGLEWAWIDNVCINKDSSAELSEAINASELATAQPIKSSDG